MTDTLKSNPKPNPTRAFAGYLIGAVAGGLLGWGIDRAITDQPYAGIRIGAFVGGMCGIVVGLGLGRLGLGFLFTIILGAIAGSLACIAIWNPDPARFYSLVPAAAGGVLGSFAGLLIALKIFKRPRPDSPPKDSGM